MSPSRLHIAAAIAMATTGAMVFLVLPLLVGQMMDDFNLDAAEAGQVASMFFAGYFLSSASAFAWVSRISLKPCALAAYLLMVLGLSGAAFATEVVVLTAGLAVAGCGSGMLYAIGVATIGRSENESRNFGLMLAGQQTMAAILYLTLPVWVIPMWGLAGCLLSLGVCSAILAVTSTWVLEQLPVSEASSLRFKFANSGPEISTLTAMLIHFTVLSALWSFVERLGTNSSLSVEFIGNALAFSMLGGLFGALTASGQGNRFGSSRPIWISAFLFLMVNISFYWSISGSVFLVGTFLLSLAWNYSLAYQMTVISNVDQGGRFTVLIPAAQAGGAMLGPAMGGLLMLMDSNAVLVACSLGILFASAIFSHFDRKVPASV